MTKATAPDRGWWPVHTDRAKRSLHFDLVTREPPKRITLETMATNRQEALPEVESGPRRRVWCTGIGCGRELFDPISRQRRKGPECDPEPRHASARFTIDQDTIPGL